MIWLVQLIDFNEMDIVMPDLDTHLWCVKSQIRLFIY